MASTKSSNIYQNLARMESERLDKLQKVRKKIATTSLKILCIPILLWFFTSMHSALFFLTIILYSIMATFLAIKIILWGGKESPNSYTQYCGDISIENKAIIIADCDSKFGQELARSLNHLGFRIIAGVLKPESKSSLKLINEACIPWKMHLIGMDTMEDKTLDDAHKSVENILLSSGDQLYGLVNGVGAFDDTSVGSSKKHCSQMMNYIFWRVANVTKKFLPLIRTDGGRILTITSTAQHQPRGSKSAYETTMYAVRAFMDSLRYELIPSDARVIEIMIALSDSRPNYQWKVLQNSYWGRSSQEENPKYYPYLAAEYDAPVSLIPLATKIFIRNETPSFIDTTQPSIKKFLKKLIGPEIDLLLDA